MFGLIKRLIASMIVSASSPAEVNQAELPENCELDPMVPEMTWFGDLYPDSEYSPQPEFTSS